VEEVTLQGCRMEAELRVARAVARALVVKAHE
jgi:hypothetical protein